VAAVGSDRQLMLNKKSSLLEMSARQ
jgi:hypothetical protein